MQRCLGLLYWLSQECFFLISLFLLFLAFGFFWAHILWNRTLLLLSLLYSLFPWDLFFLPPHTICISSSSSLSSHHHHLLSVVHPTCHLHRKSIHSPNYWHYLPLYLLMGNLSTYLAIHGYITIDLSYLYSIQYTMYNLALHRIWFNNAMDKFTGFFFCLYNPVCIRFK